MGTFAVAAPDLLFDEPTEGGAAVKFMRPARETYAGWGLLLLVFQLSVFVSYVSDEKALALVASVLVLLCAVQMLRASYN